jgi:putative acetyltransferase
MITIREEGRRESAAVWAVVSAAFGQAAEADLVESLRENGNLLLSLVAERDGEIVGHIAFSPITVESEAGDWQAVGLGPLAVAPAFQRQGFGSALMYAGLEAVRQQGHEVVFVLGHPAYYHRFGFVTAADHGLRWEREVPPEFFMVQALLEGALAGRSGVVRYGPEFDSV